MTTLTASTVPPIRVVLVDNVAMMRDVFVRRMKKSPAFQVRVATTARRAMHLAEDEMRSELVLIIARSLDVPAVTEWESLICRLRTQCPDTKIVISSADVQVIMSCLEAGAGGYVDSDLSWDEFERRLMDVYEGRQKCSSQILSSLITQIRTRVESVSTTDDRGQDRLSEREAEVARLIARGRTNKEISRELGVSLSTTKNHVHNVLQKIGARRRHQLLGRKF